MAAGDPAAFDQRVLLAVTGLSPHVVTETLFALAVLRSPPFVPTRVEILTTTEGARRAVLLLGPDGGAFAALCRDHGLRGLETVLAEARVNVMPDHGGRGLDDIRSDADNEAAADAIVGRIRDLTADPDSALHLSIAGGRKTMGFLAGHALSLFGRPQDRLSHVLVDDATLADPTIFYPPPSAGRSAPGTGAWMPALSEIPFLRLRPHLPEALLSGGRGYSETVRATQAHLDPRVVIAVDRREISAAGRTFRLPPAEFAWFAWHAWRRSRRGLPEGGAVRWTEADPAEVLRFHAMVDPDGKGLARTEAALASGMTKELFEQRTAKVNKLVEAALGLAAGPYRLVATGRRPQTRTGLTLPPDRILFREAEPP
jgi:CRISPR-associated protein (TIGR02584 family)